MADMPKLKRTEPVSGTSTKIEMEIASTVSGRSIRPEVSLTDHNIQFQHYTRSSSQNVAAGHSAIALNDFTVDRIQEVFITILDAFTKATPR